MYVMCIIYKFVYFIYICLVLYAIYTITMLTYTIILHTMYIIIIHTNINIYYYTLHYVGEANEYRERYNCRQCGNLICDPCSTRRRPVPRLGLIFPSRICDKLVGI